MKSGLFEKTCFAIMIAVVAVIIAAYVVSVIAECVNPKPSKVHHDMDGGGGWNIMY